MGYGTEQRHEPIGRATQLTAPMRVEDVVLRPMNGYPDIQTFRCSPLCADITPRTCKANYLSHKSVSCKSCPVGMMHAGTESARTAIDVLNDPNSDGHARMTAKAGLSCIRCLKSAATNKRLIAGMRLIRETVCVSCFNREREVISGRNSKNARPVKWACLRQTILTVEDESGRWKTLDPIMTTGREEAERYVARRHPDSTIVECVFDGVFIAPVAKPGKATTFADIARAAGVNVETARSRMKKHGTLDVPAPRKPGPAPRTDTLAYAARRAGVSPNTARYRLKTHGSIEKPSRVATMRDFGFGSDLAEFIEWLAKDWPAFAHEPVEPRAPAPPLVARVDAAEPVSEPIETFADNARSGIEHGIEDEWADVAVSGADGVQRLVRDLAAADGVAPVEYARRRGWIAEDEPAPAPAAPVPRVEPVKAARLTGKQQKKLEKAQRRAERLAQAQPKPKPSGLAPTMLANTCKAFVHVMFELAAAR